MLIPKWRRRDLQPKNYWFNLQSLFCHFTEEADTSAKKSSSKVEEEKEEDKTPKMGLSK